MPYESTFIETLGQKPGNSGQEMYEGEVASVADLFKAKKEEGLGMERRQLESRSNRASSVHGE